VHSRAVRRESAHTEHLFFIASEQRLTIRRKATLSQVRPNRFWSRACRDDTDRTCNKPWPSRSRFCLAGEGNSGFWLFSDFCPTPVFGLAGPPSVGRGRGWWPCGPTPFRSHSEIQSRLQRGYFRRRLRGKSWNAHNMRRLEWQCHCQKWQVQSGGWELNPDGQGRLGEARRGNPLGCDRARGRGTNTPRGREFAVVKHGPLKLYHL